MNRKKKIAIRVGLALVLLLLIFFFLKKGYEYRESVLDFGENYFGIFFIPALLIIFLDIFFSFLSSKKKRTVYKTRLFFSIVFIISSSVVFILGILKYSKRLDELNIIEECLMKYNLGFLMTNLITYLFDTYKFNYVIIFFSFLIFISLFFLTGKEIIGFIRYIIRCRKRREALKMKEALLEQMQMQIAIKETLESQKADEYEKQNIILDTVIKEKVEEAIEKDKLPVKIVIEDLKKEDTEIWFSHQILPEGGRF